MAKEERRIQLHHIFRNIDEDERILVDRLIDEVVGLEDQMDELRRYPFIKVHPDDPTRIKTTAAAKLYKETSQSYMNAIRILLNTLRKVESSEEDALLERLKEFM